MKILGIDPGSRITGYGIIENTGNSISHVDNGGIQPDHKLPFSQRLRKIFDELANLIDIHKPDIVAIENVFVAKNVRSSLLLGHARGTAMVAASLANLRVEEYSPSEVKQAIVGTGRATKCQIQHMVKAMLNLPEIAFEDASDALAVAICHCNTASFKNRLQKQQLINKRRDK
ncbi:MAG: crossover junction endodeoxyribonuclease RuvC [Deltaproteobacteria bacterium]|jgi:crossover junction endodeoxyribonuclease RuvC|nr:crossover junction endodeoxyribonuclease RuvC [Deltaproteobacteria bacterium]